MLLLFAIIQGPRQALLRLSRLESRVPYHTFDEKKITHAPFNGFAGVHPAQLVLGGGDNLPWIQPTPRTNSSESHRDVLDLKSMRGKRQSLNAFQVTQIMFDGLVVPDDAVLGVPLTLSPKAVLPLTTAYIVLGNRWPKYTRCLPVNQVHAPHACLLQASRARCLTFACTCAQCA